MRAFASFTLILAIATAVPCSAFAQSLPTTPSDQAARTAMAGELMEAMRLDRQFDAIIPSIVALVMPLVVKGNEGQEQKLRSIVTEEMTSAFQNRRSDLITSAREIYARNFSLAELSDMLTFYLSPTGKVFVEKMPTVTLESMQGGAPIGRKAAQDALPKIIDRMRAAQLAIPKGA